MSKTKGSGDMPLLERYEALQENYRAARVVIDNLHAVIEDLADEVRKLDAHEALLAACHEAHVVLSHYDLVRRPHGVDWKPVAELQEETVNQLWNAITLAQPELKQ